MAGTYQSVSDVTYGIMSSETLYLTIFRPEKGVTVCWVLFVILTYNMHNTKCMFYAWSVEGLQCNLVVYDT